MGRRFSFIPALAAAGCIALTGCVQIQSASTSNLSPQEIASLSGVWEGRASLTLGETYCPRFYSMTLRVSKGSAEGEMVDQATPNAPRTAFTTFVDYEGSLSTLARPGGRETNIRGVFARSGFAGDAKNKDCSYNVRLTRKAGA